jgi:hypothetical protein
MMSNILSIKAQTGVQLCLEQTWKFKAALAICNLNTV